MRKIALVNHKGGVGKTTTAVNLSAGLALLGKRVLIVDADPQSNCTESFGVFNSEKSIYNSFSKGEPLPIVPIQENLFLVPCSLDFAGIELEIAARMAREKILLNLVEKVQKNFDFCIIDCPPSLGLVTVNALVAADEVYIPMEAEYLAYRGIDTIVGVIEQVRQALNPTLKISGVFFTKFNSQRVLTKEISEQIKGFFGSGLLQTQIRVNVALAESQSAGKDIFSYDGTSNGAVDYLNLAKEILN